MHHPYKANKDSSHLKCKKIKVNAKGIANKDENNVYQLNGLTEVKHVVENGEETNQFSFTGFGIMRNNVMEGPWIFYKGDGTILYNEGMT